MNYLLGKGFGAFLALTWFLTGGYSIFLRKWSTNLIFISIFFVALIPYFAWGDLTAAPLNHLLLYYLFFFGIFLYEYYANLKNDREFLGRVALVTSLFYTLGAVQTYIGLSLYPEASRILASGSGDSPIKHTYSKIGIGGFNYVYSACFLVIMLFYLWFERKDELPRRHRMMLLLCVLLLAITVVKASYAIAVFIMLAGMISVPVFRSKTSQLFTLVFGFIVLLVVKGNTELLFQKLAAVFRGNTIIFDKINDLANALLKGSSKGKTSTSYRIYLYSSSLKTFLSQPCFGVHGPFGDRNAFVGEHSGWFDLLARYGLFVSLPMFGTIITHLKNVAESFRETRTHLPLLAIFALFGLYGTINPVFALYQIGLVVFFIIPSLSNISYMYLAERVERYGHLGGDQLQFLQLAMIKREGHNHEASLKQE